jgi:hypothetical protein
MSELPAEIAAYQVQHVPIIKASADELGLVGLINHYVPTEEEERQGWLQPATLYRVVALK